jgi:hypothetical protein
MSKMLGWGCFLLAGLLLAAAPAARAQELELSLDEQYARLAESVPGFGGLYLDEEGTTHVYLQDLSREREVQNLGERVVVHQGDYDFRDLFAWREEVRPQLAERGAVSLDIDERRNRLVFGVERESLGEFAARLGDFLRGTRVPPEAVTVEDAEPVSPFASLSDKIRPVPGGVKITPVGSGVMPSCTLGVNAIWFGVKGFIINSHCTQTRSFVDGTLFYQNTFTSANLIGIETIDPPYFISSPCPAGRKCRRSDASFASYATASDSQGGKIANPVICGFGGLPGSTNINPAQPRLSVTNFLFGTPAGSFVWKVGITTGCTMGSLKNTCVDVNTTNSYTMLCQDQVSAKADFGDSGSPVFLQSGTEATLVGILWGGSLDGLTYTYSPWLFVHGELGGVTPNLQ